MYTMNLLELSVDKELLSEMSMKDNKY
jgi:hypothetical protein